MRRVLALTCFATLGACQTGDLTLPTPPPKPLPGTLYGRVVYAVPGQATTQPAPAASITILETGLSTLSGPDGHFLLSGVTQSTGELLIRFDSTGNGMIDHQKLIQLSDVNAGLGRQIALGDVLVVANAMMQGTVLLGDKVGQATGHGGTTVFVPAGPFTAYSNDDGSYSLGQLPAGTLTIQFFHDGYDPFELDDVVLGAGQNFNAAEIVLDPVAMAPAPGEISGKIQFGPQPSDPTSTVVAAVDSNSHATAGSVQHDGTFTVPNVPAGVYSLNVSHPGYTTDVLNNVFVTSGNEVVLPLVSLQAGNGVLDCNPGDICSPATPCHTGITDCSTGTATCTDTGSAPDGTVCGVDHYCSAGECETCPEGSACVPTLAPCHTGSISCTTGTSVCVDDAMDQLNGTMCGSDAVCNTGACVSCPQGSACTPSNACHTGSIDCTSGSPVCDDTEGAVSDGTVCGTSAVCNSGICVSCEAGSSCTPAANPCHTGTLSCSTGMGICSDSGSAVDGTICGVDQVCQGGDCVACTDGLSCVPTAAPCHGGTIFCANGTAVCVDDATNQANGTTCGDDQVCNSGSCASCAQGQTCTPTNTCHTGTIDCSTGSPVCEDNQGTVSNGMVCGTGMVCNSGLCVACLGGTSCTPPGNACATGTVACTTGSPICMASGNASDGTVCGVDQVCLTGTCTSCTDGVACTPPAAPCHTGATSCLTGTTLCIDTTMNQPNGTTCGEQEFCNDGSCVSCSQGQACTPSNTCHTGTIDCSTGSPVCEDNQGAVSNGLVCGTGEVCNSGVCVACLAGASCTPAGNTCATGKIACDTGSAICMASGNAANGTACGIDQVCLSGACSSCADGVACIPSTAPCHTGVTSCLTGASVCLDNMGSQPDGLICGTDEVCNSGSCVSCPQGSSCTPANGCHTGSVDCSTGSPVCLDTMGTLGNGMSCGTGAVCSGGNCVACAAGGVCIPTTAPCHNGAFACNTGEQVCVDQQTNADDGIGCGQNAVCDDGACVACSANASCVPSDNICNSGVTSCTSGVSACVDTTMPAADGFPCGTGMFCQAGVCRPSGWTIVASPQPATVLSITGSGIQLQLNDQSGAVLVGATVTCTAPNGGACFPSSATTDVNGDVTFVPSLPRQPGSYNYIFASAGQGQIVVPVTATAIPPGYIYTLVNRSRSGDYGGIPGSAPYAHVNGTAGVALASDGSVYFSSGRCEVYRLSASGQVTLAAGTLGSCGYSGDNGPAVSAQLYQPEALALDETAQVLYIADVYNELIRAVDLSTGKSSSGNITTYAGGGNGGYPNNGDGLTALSATFSFYGNQSDIAVGPDEALYVSDMGNDRIRRIDPQTRIINAWNPPQTQVCPATAGLANCSGSNGCHLAWDATGTAYVSGQIWGQNTGICFSGSNVIGVPGVIRFHSDGTADLVAGLNGGASNTGSPAVVSALPATPLLAFDTGGDLFLSYLQNNSNPWVIQRVDAVTDVLSTVAGDSSQGFSGDSGLATEAQIAAVGGFGLDAYQDILFADSGNGVIREVAAPASTQPTTVTLTPVIGTLMQTAVVDQPPANYLSIVLTDSSGPIEGYPIHWAAVTEGGWMQASATTTDITGTASVQVRPGRAVGTYQFTATVIGFSGPTASQTFTVTAGPATAGDIYTLVNVPHTQGDTTIPYPGTEASVGGPQNLAIASDGTIYFNDASYHLVRKLSPMGLVTIVAGNGSSGYSGDNGLATAAQLGSQIYGIALDEVSQALYIATNNPGAVIRAVDLTTGIITTLGGNGTAGAPGYGNGGPAADAIFQLVSNSAIGPNRLLYFLDAGAFRTIDLSDPLFTIQAATVPTGQGCAGPLVLSGCNDGAGCMVAWDGDQNMYVSGDLAGWVNGCNAAPGVMRVNHSDGSVALVFGLNGGLTIDGYAASETAASLSPWIALDTAGNIYLSMGSSNVIKRIEVASGTLHTMAGTGSAGYAGDDAAASGAVFNTPIGIAVDPSQNLVIADSGNDAIRTIVGEGSVAGGGAQLAILSGNPQNVPVATLAGAPLAVKLTDSSGNPLVGYPVTWTSLTPGAGFASSSGQYYSFVSRTDTSGVVEALAEVDLLVTGTGTPNQFTASFKDANGLDVTGSPATFNLTATAPAAGTIFSVVNSGHGEGNTTSQTRPLALVNTVRGMTASPVDGSIYFADASNGLIRRLTLAGDLTDVAGGGSSLGDFGPATSAHLSQPADVTFDPAGATLYIADTSNNRVRAVDMATGIITTFAGGGTGGDGSQPAAASLSNPTRVAFGPDGHLYIADYQDDAIRYVDLVADTINTLITGTGNNCTTAPARLVSSYDTTVNGPPQTNFDMAWDSAGNAYVSGYIIGTGPDNLASGATACSQTPGIIEIAGSVPGGAITHVAGMYQGSTADGGLATAEAFLLPPSLLFDSSGNLYTFDPAGNSSDAGGNVVRRIDAVTRQMTTVAGNWTAGSSGDNGPATAAELNGPWSGLFLPGGHLLVSDSNNNSLREVW